jgi:succinate dehydrogenase / fumarate reductase, membrane anchor subunit
VRTGRASRAWLLQRASSIALVPLAVWLLASLLTLPTFEYTTVTSWVAKGWTPLLLLLFVLTAACHSQLGVREVVEDYVHGTSSKTLTMLAVTLVHIVLAFAAAWAILRIASGATT